MWGFKLVKVAQNRVK